MATAFDVDEMARWYATQHLRTDPGVREIYYLPKGAPDREIRFIEVNTMIVEMKDASVDPVDFGVDRGAEAKHKLFVIDVTPGQWEAIHEGDLPLPEGWNLEEAIAFSDELR